MSNINDHSVVKTSRDIKELGHKTAHHRGKIILDIKECHDKKESGPNNCPSFEHDNSRQIRKWAIKQTIL